MTFADRKDAGIKLGQKLVEFDIQPDLVLGLPRGGVVVAAEVAHCLNRPLDTMVVRKIGHPRHREFAVGALAEDGTRLLSQNAMKQTRVVPEELEIVIAEELNRLTRYRTEFHRPHPLNLEGKIVLLVDDGLATGASAEVAVLALRKQSPRQIIVAAPVASDNAFHHLRKVADNVIALIVDENFEAVGQYYRDFSQTTDEQVKQLLAV